MCRRDRNVAVRSIHHRLVLGTETQRMPAAPDFEFGNGRRARNVGMPQRAFELAIGRESATDELIETEICLPQLEGTRKRGCGYVLERRRTKSSGDP